MTFWGFGWIAIPRRTLNWCLPWDKKQLSLGNLQNLTKVGKIALYWLEPVTRRLYKSQFLVFCKMYLSRFHPIYLGYTKIFSRGHAIIRGAQSHEIFNNREAQKTLSKRIYSLVQLTKRYQSAPKVFQRVGSRDSHFICNGRSRVNGFWTVLTISKNT